MVDLDLETSNQIALNLKDCQKNNTYTRKNTHTLYIVLKYSESKVFPYICKFQEKRNDAPAFIHRRR